MVYSLGDPARTRYEYRQKEGQHDTYRYPYSGGQVTTRILGELEIDHDRGVLYFHTSDPEIASKYGSVTILRICRLPSPIPPRALDITHMFGTDWTKTKRGVNGDGRASK